MKRCIISLFFLFFLFAFSAMAQTFESGPFTFKILDADKLTVELVKPTAGKCVGEVTIPEIANNGVDDYTVVRIGMNAFTASPELTQVNVPNTVKEIADGVFHDCSQLAILNLGNSLEKIGSWAFGYCHSLRQITCLASIPPVTTQSFNSINLATSVLYVPYECGDAYRNAEDWLNFGTINELLYDTLIEQDGIYYQVVDTVLNYWVEVAENPGDYYKGDVVVLDSVTHEGRTYSVEGIGYRAFAQCSELQSVLLPSTIQYIASEAFVDCTSLKWLACLAMTPPRVEDAFLDVDFSASTLYVPSESVACYDSSELWGRFQEVLAWNPSALDDASAPINFELRCGTLYFDAPQSIRISTPSGQLVYEGEVTEYKLPHDQSVYLLITSQGSYKIMP